MVQIQPILKVSDLSLSFGGIKALQAVDFAVKQGELFSIIGPNGAGKTSLLNCISGRYKPQHGSILFKGRELIGLKPNARGGLGIGRTFQNLALFNHMTVFIFLCSCIRINILSISEQTESFCTTL